MISNIAYMLMGLSVFWFIVVAFIGLLVLVFEVWMFVAVILDKKIDSGRKALWIIGMLVIHPFVAIGYFFTDFQKSK